MGSGSTSSTASSVRRNPKRSQPFRQATQTSPAVTNFFVIARPSPVPSSPIPIVFDLLELAEDCLKFVFGNTDAGILDGDVDTVVLTMTVRKSHHADQYMTVLGELDRVADEVREYLPNAARVANADCRHERS